MTDRHRRLSAARVYLVCDELPDAMLSAALRGGVDIVQLRMKLAADDDVLRAGRHIRALCHAHGALFILNDRPDLAAVLDADGVHIGQDDASVAEARAHVGSDRLIGLSTHTPAQVDASAEAGVDYIGVGPVHATPTKPGRPAVGSALVRYAGNHARLPFFAIGGITTQNAAAVRAAGAERVAVVRAITQASDPAAAARGLRRALEAGRQEASVGAT